MVDLKVPLSVPVGQLFGRIWGWDPRTLGLRVAATTIFSPKVANNQKRKISIITWIIISWVAIKNFNSFDKNGWVMAKKRMPKYGHAPHFWPSRNICEWNQYHSICNCTMFSVIFNIQGQKSWKHNFEIAGELKGPPSGSTFWLGFEVTDPYGYLWGHALF